MTVSPLGNTRTFTLMALAGSVLLASLGISIASVAQPTLSQVFAAPISSIQWVVLGYLMAVTIVIVPVGRMGDLWGHKRMLIAGLLLFMLASIACALALSLQMLVISRIVQGCGAAILMALPMSIIRQIVGKEHTGRAMGLLGTVSALGTALGPSLGGVLLEHSSWQAAFGLLAAISLVVCALAGWAIPAKMTMPSSAPSLSFSLLCGRLIASSLMTNFLVTTVLMSTLVVGPFYLLFGLQLSQSMVGVVMAIGPVTAALFGLPAGWLTDRFGTSRMMLAGLLQMSLSLICLAVLPRLLGVWGYVFSLMLLTPGFQLFLAANSTAVMLTAREQQRGIVSGLLGVSRNLGFMAGASLMAMLFATALGKGDIATIAPQTIGDAFSVTFSVAALITLLALTIYKLGPVRPVGAER